MSTKMQTVKIKNYQLKFVTEWLDGPLPIKEARSRNRFLHLLAPRIKEIEDERNKIILDKCDKDEDGKPIIEKTDQGSTYKFSGDTWQEVQKEIVDLFNEDLIIEVTPANEADIKIVKGLILETTKTLDTQQTEVYEQVAKEFEALEFQDEK
jgi:hypothetical protein